MAVGPEADSVQHLWRAQPAVQQFLPEAQGASGQEAERSHADSSKAGQIEDACAARHFRLSPSAAPTNLSAVGSVWGAALEPGLCDATGAWRGPQAF